MKCPNCRCIIPSTSEVCSYCGYELVAGCRDTYKIDDNANYSRQYNTQCNNYYDNYYATDTYYGYNKYNIQQDYYRHGYEYPDNCYHNEKVGFVQRILDTGNGGKFLLLIFAGMTYLEILLLCVLFLFM